MAYARTIDIEIEEGVLIRFSQSGRPIERYSVVLLAFEDGDPTNEAIPAAIDHLKAHWKAIIESWRS